MPKSTKIFYQWKSWNGHPKGGQAKKLQDLETTRRLKIGISIDQPINYIFIEASGEVQIRNYIFLSPAGAAAARVQRVHLHPSISSNGRIAPVLMKKCPISGSISVWNELFETKKELFESNTELLDAKIWYNFEFLGYGITLLPSKIFMHPSCQVLGAAPAIVNFTF